MFRSKLNPHYILFVIFSLFVINLPAQDIQNKFNRYIFDYQKNKNIPSISAAILQNDKIIWRGAEGFADIENSVYASPRTVYRIASISKMITAVAIMQLVEKGKIKLDDDARKYLPNFPEKKWKFTIRQLLSHSSGIRTYRAGEFDSKTFYPSINDAIKMLADYPLEYEPGTKYLYTSLAYNLLAGIIEKVSGISYRSYIELNIFSPLQMYSSYLEVQSEIVPERAHGYFKGIYRKILNAPLTDLSLKFPGGGIISTTNDLLRFGNSFLNGTLLRAETVEKMIEPLKLKDGTIIHYGLGCEVRTDSEGRFYFGHVGGGTGFTSHLVIYPKEKLVSVSLINIRDRNLGSPALAIVHILLDDAKPVVLPSLSDKLFEITYKTGIDSAISFYHLTEADSVLQKKYMWNKDELLEFGNDLQTAELTTFAIKYFKFLVNEVPQNPRVYIGLAEAYLQDGNKGLSTKFYKEAYRLDSKNEKLKKILGISSGNK